LSESLAAANELLPVILFSQHLAYRGADLTLVCKDGKTPLDLAMESGDEKTIILLREESQRG